MRKTALIYVRRSFIRKGEEAISPEKQEDNCRRISDEAGWTAEVYRDAEEGKHFSAISEMGRPAWLKLKRQLGRPDVVAVIVDSLDRAYRSLRDFLDFLALIDKYHVRFISNRETIDTESVMGQALLKMMMVFYELESKMASQRTMEVMQHRKEKGIHCGSNPFGLTRREDSVFIANEDLSTLLLLLELYATGQESYRSVAEKLNLMGRRFRDQSGNQKPFTRESVRSIINNVLIYLGYIPQHKASGDQLPIGGDLVNQLVYQTDAVPGQHEAVISRELANRILAARRARFKGRRRKARIYLLTGILHCCGCGGPMRGFRNRWGDRAYQYRHSEAVCRPRWMSPDADALEDRVIGLLEVLELPPQLQEAIRARAREQGGLLPEQDEARQAVARLQGKLHRLREMRLEGEYSKEEYEAKKGPLVQELQKWGQAGRSDYNLDRALLDLSNMAEILRQGPPAAQKKALHSLFERIEVNAQGEITKAIPREWCRPLFSTLQDICDVEGDKGAPDTGYVARLEALLDLVVV